MKKEVMENQEKLCIKCKKQLFSDVTYCPYCGKKQDDQEDGKIESKTDKKFSPELESDKIRLEVESKLEEEFSGAYDDGLKQENNQYTLTYKAGNNGSIEGDSPQTVNHGEGGTPITAVPAEGYHFEKWSDGVVEPTRTDIAIKNDIDVVATFSINQYTLTYKAEDNGSITGESFQKVTQGENGTAVTATSEPGYQFVKWSDGFTDNPRTDTKVTGNIDVTANIKKKKANLIKVLPFIIIFAVLVVVGTALLKSFFVEDKEIEVVQIDQKSLAQEALRNGVNIGILTNELERAYAVIERAQRLADMSSRYQKNLEVLEKPIPGLESRLQNQLHEYQVNITGLADSGTSNIESFLKAFDEKTLSSREKLVVELISVHVQEYKKSDSVNSQGWLESFQREFKDFVD